MLRVRVLPRTHANRPQYHPHRYLSGQSLHRHTSLISQHPPPTANANHSLQLCHQTCVQLSQTASTAANNVNIRRYHTTQQHQQRGDSKKRSNSGPSQSDASFQIVSQLEQLLAASEPHVSMFERSLRLIAGQRDPETASAIWDLLDRNQPAGTPSISYPSNQPLPTTQKAPLYPRQETYNLAIQALLILDVKTPPLLARKAVKLFRRAAQLGFKFEQSTYIALINALNGRGRPDATGLQLIFDHYVAAAEANDHAKMLGATVDVPNVFLTVRAISRMLYAWTREFASSAEDDQTRAMRSSAIARLLELAKTKNLPLDRSAPEAMLSWAITQGNLDQADKLVDQIRTMAGGVCPSDSIHSMMLKFCAPCDRSNPDDILASFPKAADLLNRCRQTWVHWKPLPTVIEAYIEAGCRYHIARIGQRKINEYTAQDAANILQSLCNVLRIFDTAYSDWLYVFHKLTYIHLFYAITQVAQHVQAMNTGLPYDARESVKENDRNSRPPHIAVESRADPSVIGAECMRLDILYLLRAILKGMQVCSYAPLPQMFVFEANFLLPQARRYDKSMISRLDEQLVYSLFPAFISQAMLLPPAILDQQFAEFQRDHPTDPLAFPPPSHTLHRLLAKQMHLVTFRKFYFDHIAFAHHKPRACTAEQQRAKTPQLAIPNPAHTGEESLKEMSFIAQEVDILRQIELKKAHQRLAIPTRLDVSYGQQLRVLLSAMGSPPPLGSRLLAMNILQLHFYHIHIRLPPHAQATRHTSKHLGPHTELVDGDVSRTIERLVDRAQLFRLDDYLLQPGEVGERILTVLLYRPVSRSFATTIFNHYRTNLLQHEAKMGKPEDPEVRQLYRPILIYLAQQNQREAYDGIMQELEMTGCFESPLFHSDKLFRSDILMCGLTHESTKLFRTFHRLIQIDQHESVKLLTPPIVAGFVEAIDRCEDEGALEELLSSPSATSYLFHDRSILQLLIRALIRHDGFLHPSPSKLDRAMSLFFAHWGQISNSDLPFLMHMLKCALIVGDEPTLDRLTNILSQHGAAFDLSQLADDAPTIVYQYPTVSHLWAECVVPYPQFLFRPKQPHSPDELDPLMSDPSILLPSNFAPYSGAVPLTHPDAIKLSNQFRPILTRAGLSGDIPDIMSQIDHLHSAVLAAEHQHTGTGINHLALSESTIEQIRLAQDQIIDETVKQLAKAAIIRCGV